MNSVASVVVRRGSYGSHLLVRKVMRPQSQKQSCCDDRYGGLYFFDGDFSTICYTEILYQPFGNTCDLPILHTFCGHFSLVGDPGEAYTKFATKLGQWGIPSPKYLHFSGSC